MNSYSSTASRKRNAESAGFESSPGSVDDEGGQNYEHADAAGAGALANAAAHAAAQAAAERRRQPVKRACNECRQQKVR